MRIAILGASVSAQTTNHITGEVTGYAEVLRREYPERMGVTEIRQISYPGNRASDGGIIQLEHVLRDRPDICLFEPLVEDRLRGVDIADDEMRFIYGRLLAADILPVTLLLPAPPQRDPARNPNYWRYNIFCRDHGLPVIRLDVTAEGPLEQLFNGMHTALGGARIYASRIAAALTDLISSGWQTVDLAAHLAPSPVQLTRLALSVGWAGLPKIRHIAIRLRTAATPCPRLRLVRLQTIGTRSPVLDIAVRVTRPSGVEDLTAQRLSVWDLHCHYQRRSFVSLHQMALGPDEDVVVSVNVADIAPDYSLCRRAMPSWPAVHDLVLEPLAPLFVIANGPVGGEVSHYEQENFAPS